MREAVLKCIAGAGLVLAAAHARAGCYMPDVDASSLRFTAMQRGEPFEGRFLRFDGTLCLDSGAPEAGTIVLRVYTESVDSGLPEADAALRSALFLDAAAHPEAVFTGNSIGALGGDRYQVDGTFTLRDGMRELAVPFTFRPLPEGGALLEGETAIRRLDYGVGLGEWLDTQYLEDRVALKFAVRLVPVAAP